MHDLPQPAVSASEPVHSPFRPDTEALKTYFDLCFQQVQLESTLINYRFVWAMFANGALVTLFVHGGLPMLRIVTFRLLRRSCRFARRTFA